MKIARNIRQHVTPFGVVFIAFATIATTLFLRTPPDAVAPPAPEPTETEIETETIEPGETSFAAITGSRVEYIVPQGTRRITTNIREPNGSLVRSFVITNWVTIKPGQKLELLAD